MKNDFPRLSRKEYIILDLLDCSGEMFGLEMVENSKNALKRGTIYVTLQRMAEKGFVESWEEARVEPEIGIARRKYRATELGHRVFRAQNYALGYLNLDTALEAI